MKTLNSLLVCGSLIIIGTFATASLPAATLYSLSTTVLDGGAGENTYISANGSGSGLVYNSGTPSLAVTLPTSGGYAQLIGNFTSSSLVSVGDVLTLSYSFTVSSATTFGVNDQTFRVGLYNSNGTLLTGNSSGADAAVTDDTGYMAGYRPTAGTNGAANSIYQRTVSGQNVLLGTGANTLVSGAPTPLDRPGVSTVTGSLTLSLVATGVQISSVMNGAAAQSVIDTTGTVQTFNEFGLFGLSGSLNPTITLTNLTVDFAAVPEPSTWALLGMGLGVLVFLRRRSKTQS